MWKFQQYLDNCCKINTVLKHWYVAWEMIHRHIFNNNTQFISQYCISTNKIHYMYQDSLHHRGKTDGLVHLMAQVWLCSDHQRQHFRFRKIEAGDHYSPGAGQVKTHRKPCGCISRRSPQTLYLQSDFWFLLLLYLPASASECLSLACHPDVISGTLIHKTAAVLIILHNRDINEEAFKTLF